MATWKRRIAREWLIFLVAFGGTVLFCYAFTFTGNLIIDAKYSSAQKEYKDQLKQSVQKNSVNWKPKYDPLKINNKPSDSKKDIFDSIWIPDEPKAPSHFDYIIKYFLLLTIAAYLSVLLTRLTVWSIKYAKKDKHPTD